MDIDDDAVSWENPDSPVSSEDYLFRNEKRLVRPYFFEFVCNIKKRWAGKTIVDLFSQEFRQRPREYYIQATARGRIRVNGMRVTPSYVVRDSQKVSHFVHRHEPPVLAETVELLEKKADIIVVNKPPSVPVHPCGQYRKNTVVGILQAEHQTGQLFPIHRLDRLVSGLLILARNAKTANDFRQEVTKQYVAKVKGVFPPDELEVNAAVTYDPREGVSTCTSEPSDSGAQGKEACTRFQRLRTDGVYSIVRCEPVTGRTHQIRVHLQHLGHPIANDDLYLHINPPKRSWLGTTADSAAKLARSCTNSTSRLVDDEYQEQDFRKDGEEVEVRNGKETLKERDRSDFISNPDITQISEFVTDRLCTHCPRLEPCGYKQDDAGLWLHCVRYSGTSWTYECPLPSWAL